MSFEQIIYESGAAVATVTLNRPDRLNIEWSPARTGRSVRALISEPAGRRSI